MKQRIFSHFHDYLIQYISHQYQDLLYCNSSQYVLSTYNSQHNNNNNVYAFCKIFLYYKFIRYVGIYHKELYSVDILCENSTSTMPVSRGEGWVFSCLSSYA